jgi:hypothetical protein
MIEGFSLFSRRALALGLWPGPEAVEEAHRLTRTFSDGVPMKEAATGAGLPFGKGLN